MGTLSGLTSLSLYSNQLSALPVSLWQLQRLRTLNLAENHLISLAEGIGRLTSLEMLDRIHQPC